MKRRGVVAAGGDDDGSGRQLQRCWHCSRRELLPLLELLPALPLPLLPLLSTHDHCG